MVILPNDKLQEVAGAPTDQFDFHLGNDSATAPIYTTGKDVQDGPHFNVVRKQLTRRLPLLTADVHEELALGIQDNWKPRADKWTTVKAYDSCMKIVSRAANRVFCGKELCRNPEFLENTRLYAVETFATGFKLKLVPQWLHPIAGPLVARPVKRCLAVCQRICAPVIDKRLRNMLDPELAKNFEAPNDTLQWLLEDLVELAKTNPKELDISLNVRRLMTLNMVAIHTTSITITDTLLDMYSHPEAERYVAGLREECERVLTESDGKWSKDAVNKLVRVDSVIRETMRFSSMSDFGMRRMVSFDIPFTMTSFLTDATGHCPLRRNAQRRHPPTSRRLHRVLQLPDTHRSQVLSRQPQHLGRLSVLCTS